MMDSITFEIVEAIVCAVATVIGILLARVAIPYIRALKLTEEQELALVLVESAVRAVEQTLFAPGQGRAKKAEVIKFASHELSERGIHITEEQLDKLIESAVYSLNQEKGL